MEVSYISNPALLVLGMASLIDATVFDKKFLARIEDVTKTNQDLTDTNKELTNTNRALNVTVIEQRQTMLNMTSKIKDLEEIVAVLEVKNNEYDMAMSAMNQTLSVMEGMQNSEYVHKRYLSYTKQSFNYCLIWPLTCLLLLRDKILRVQ